MNFTICTQSEEIINLENIISISYMPAETEDIYSGKSTTVFVISAWDVTDNEFQISDWTLAVQSARKIKRRCVMKRRILMVAMSLILICSFTACRADTWTSGISENNSYENAEGTQIKMITENTEVIITLNDSRAAADLVAMLPLELTLIERNGFAKGMTLPEHLSSTEATIREYEIGDFGYWNAGPDLAIFYDDIYERTIVEVIPLGHAETGAETLANEVGTVRLELVNEKGEQTENE